MVTERQPEYQFSFPLARYVALFNSGMAGGSEKPGEYPLNYDVDPNTGDDWGFLRDATRKANDFVYQLRQKEPGQKGLDLFYKVVKEAEKDILFKGRTSHILFGLFNSSWMIEDTGLDEYIKDNESGESINPTFKEGQAGADLHPNLQIRGAIRYALFSDMQYHKEIAEKEIDASDDAADAKRDLAEKRTTWYQTFIEIMNDKVQIQPADQPLK